MPDDLDGFAGAYGPGFRFHDENLAMLSWCAERTRRALQGRQVASLVSLGIGHEIVSREVAGLLGHQLSEYTIVEGSSEVIRRFLAGPSLPPQVRIVHQRFEDYRPDGPVDAVEMGFVLEHVDDPAALLRRYSEFLKPGGCAFVTVPNARSLHRLVGHAAGLLDDLYRLSPEDLRVGHKRYLDLASVTALVEQAGLRITRAEGVLLKCFSTAQLQALALPAGVRRAFFEVATSLPDLSNAIYLEAVR